jgi:hypothetical protein
MLKELLQLSEAKDNFLHVAVDKDLLVWKDEITAIARETGFELKSISRRDLAFKSKAGLTKTQTTKLLNKLKEAIPRAKFEALSSPTEKKVLKPDFRDDDYNDHMQAKWDAEARVQLHSAENKLARGENPPKSPYYSWKPGDKRVIPARNPWR